MNVSNTFGSAAVIWTAVLVILAIVTLWRARSYFVTETSPPVGTTQAVPPPEMSSGMPILIGFAIIVVVFSAIVGYMYRDKIPTNRDTIIWAIALALVMIGGMFINVIASNLRAGKPPTQITATQLLLPLVFSFFTFYAVWIATQQTPRDLNAIYTAFVSGYFWESIVEKAKPPDPAK